MVKSRAILFAALANLVTHPAYAHNGALASVKPIDNITVDGDLSDWPAGFPVHTIDRWQLYDIPSDSADYAAAFRVGYEQATNALFVAVVVRDESIVVDTTAVADWNTSDGCELYVDTTHAVAGSLPKQYAIYDPVHGVKARRGGKLLLGTLGQVDAAVRATPTGRTYEWRVPMPGDGRQHRSIGFDLAIVDRDADGSFTWTAWGRGRRKFEGRHGGISSSAPGWPWAACAAPCRCLTLTGTG